MENTLQGNETHLLQLNNLGSKVNYIQTGKGSPVILAHGLAASLYDWNDMLPELAASGYAGYALDLLGHGESEKPSDPDAYTVEKVYAHFSDWITSLKLNEPMILIGHSLGGGLALMYALQYPERVRALVLVNPFYEVKQLSVVLQSMFLGKLMNARLLELMPYRLFRFFVDLTSLNFHFGRGERHVLPEPIREQTALDYQRASSGIYNIPRTLPNILNDLPHVQQPTLMLWGGHDSTLAPNSFVHLRQMLPNVHGAHVLPLCGHVPHQCHPALFNPFVMEFLNSL
jgi:pimeloyl-ACP methyl ester carboxylesterase